MEEARCPSTVSRSPSASEEVVKLPATHIKNDWPL